MRRDEHPARGDGAHSLDEAARIGGLGDRARGAGPQGVQHVVVASGIGFYDGVFGPGTGSFFMLGFVTLAGFGVLKATAHTKFLNFGSNIGAFGVFLFFGAILWKVGLMMGFGQFLGAQVGSRYAMAKGAKIIKPLLVFVSIALAIRLLAVPTHPLRIWLGL